MTLLFNTTCVSSLVAKTACCLSHVSPVGVGAKREHGQRGRSSSGKYKQAGFGMTQRQHESNIEHGTQSDVMGVKSSLGLGALCACVHQCVYARVSDSSRTRTGLGALCKRGPRHRTFVHVLARHRHSTAVDGDAAQAYWCASGLQEQNWRVTYKRENH